MQERERLKVEKGIEAGKATGETLEDVLRKALKGRLPKGDEGDEEEGEEPEGWENESTVKTTPKPEKTAEKTTQIPARSSEVVEKISSEVALNVFKYSQGEGEINYAEAVKRSIASSESRLLKNEPKLNDKEIAKMNVSIRQKVLANFAKMISDLLAKDILTKPDLNVTESAREYAGKLNKGLRLTNQEVEEIITYVNTNYAQSLKKKGLIAVVKKVAVEKGVPIPPARPTGEKRKLPPTPAAPALPERPEAKAPDLPPRTTSAKPAETQKKSGFKGMTIEEMIAKQREKAGQ